MPTYLEFRPLPWKRAVEYVWDKIDLYRFWMLDFLDDETYGVPSLWLAGREPLKEPHHIVKLITVPFNLPDDLDEKERARRQFEADALQRATALAVFAMPFVLEQLVKTGQVPKEGPMLGRLNRREPWATIENNPTLSEEWSLSRVVPTILRTTGPMMLVYEGDDDGGVERRWKEGDRSLLPTDMICHDPEDNHTTRRHLFRLEWSTKVPDPLLKAALLVLAQLPFILHHIYATGDVGKLADPRLLAGYGFPEGKALGRIISYGWAAGHELAEVGSEPEEDVFVADDQLVKRFRDLDDKEVHDLTVASWLDFSTELTKKAAAATPLAQGDERLMVDLMPVIRDARVLQFRPEVVHRVLGEVDRYVGKICAGDKEQIDSEGLLHGDEVARDIPFPSPLPFNSIYIGWGPGVPATPSIKMVMTDMMYPPTNRRPLVPVAGETITHPWKRGDDNMVIAYLNGLLITTNGPDGELGNAYMAIENHNHKANVILGVTRKGKWILPTFLQGPWLLAWMVAAINANDLVIDDKHSLRRRMTLHKYFKKFGHRPLPRPWYMVTLHPGVLKVRRTIVNSMPREWRHRWDVIGHDVRRVKRGDLPLSEADIRDLTKRHYRIFTRLNPPDADALEVLMRVDEPPPADDEWVAVQKVWRRAYVKGPADKPYVPSVHALRKKRA